MSAAVCEDLRLGGTLTSGGLSGGKSINSTDLMVADWSQLFGSWGIAGAMQAVDGRPGAYLSGDLLARERYPILNMEITRRPPNVSPAPATIPWQEQLQENTDTFLELLTDPDGNYLEVDMPDGTSRFLHVTNLDPATIVQPRSRRTLQAPLVSPMPYWKEGGTEGSQVVSGATVMAVGGNRGVYDAILTFSGNGTFTHSGLGWAIQVTGAAGAVTVDLGAREVIEGGSPALNRIRRTPAAGKGRIWGWFEPGNNSVTSTVSVTVTWRSSWA